ncbi:hypothetical protein ACQCWA_00180 [Rossellomorea aquimaris]|uniref:hypothetical protein n=1 Tax=Rossellomorea aquimaris TaxID=189382 RepID=UPI003CF291AA
MSKQHELINVLKTLQTYAECDITQSFSKNDSDVLLVYYCKETESFIIIQNEKIEAYDDINSALSVLENLLQTN